MKKLIFAGIAIAILAAASCSKDKALAPNDTITVCDSVGGYTYALHAKQILDVYCATDYCHGAVGYNKDVQLHSYTTAKDAFEHKDALCSMQGQCTPMPAAGLLSDSLVAVLECWQNNGYPQ
jgi:hypothetical protein